MNHSHGDGVLALPTISYGGILTLTHLVAQGGRGGVGGGWGHGPPCADPYKGLLWRVAGELQFYRLGLRLVQGYLCFVGSPV